MINERKVRCDLPQRWFLMMPWAGLFVSVRQFQNSFLSEGFAEQLKADGQLGIFCETARQA
jgi:hypothetical protein